MKLIRRLSAKRLAEVGEGAATKAARCRFCGKKGGNSLDQTTPLAYTLGHMTTRITVVETSLYLSRAERMMSEAERDHVVDVISENPEAGVVIKGTGGLRKMRIALQGRGKRGGGRIVYWFHSPDYPTVLMLAFAKNEADDLSSEQKKRLIAAIEGLYEDFGVRR